MNLIAKFLATVFGLLLAAYVVPGFTVSGVYIASIVAVIFGILNITIKPVLTLLTLPLNIVTFGLFSLVINAGLILLVASFVEGFDVEGFVPALIGGVIIALIGWVVEKLAKN